MPESAWYTCSHCKAKYRGEDVAEICCGLSNTWREPA